MKKAISVMIRKAAERAARDKNLPVRGLYNLFKRKWSKLTPDEQETILGRKLL